MHSLLTFAAVAMSSIAIVPVAQAQSTQVMSACVAKSNGDARLVSAASACHAATETFGQWNVIDQAGANTRQQESAERPANTPLFSPNGSSATPQAISNPESSSQTGPESASGLRYGGAGPLGVQSPAAGAGLGPLFITVPATENYLANGLALANAVAASQAINASATVVFQLGPGGYDLPSTLHLSPGYSLQGAGMLSTFVEPVCLTCAGNTTISVVLNDSADTGNISNLTIIGSADSEPLAVENKGLFTIDHVRTIQGKGGANLLQPADNSGKILVFDSLLGQSRILPLGSFSAFNTEVDPIINNEVDASTASAEAKFMCSAAYNAAGTILSTSTCR